MPTPHCIPNKALRIGRRIDQRVNLDAAQPSCVAFGGESLDLLYVTSARRGLPHHEQDSGRVYEIAGTGALGVTESRFEW